jgi:predicted MPP superfamily phosphohydrolase
MMVGAVAGAALMTYAWYIEPRRIVVDRITVPVQGLAPELDGFTLVQLSDMHCGPSDRWRDHLERAVAIANSLNPHLICLTGDFTDDTGIVHECATILAALHARHGVIAVLGNHDFYGVPRRSRMLEAALRDVGITVLRNEVFEVAARSPLHVVGLDDAYSGHDKLALVLERLPRCRHPRVMLSHYPDVVERLAPGTIDLVLSGHVHGGQIRIPLLVSLVRQHHVHSSYSHGLYDVDGTLLYVNRGLGSSFPQARFFSPPEVTHFTLVPGAQS